MASVPEAGNRDTTTFDQGHLSPAPQKPSPWGDGPRSMLIAYLLHIMGGGGFIGLHRFYLGRTRSAQAQAALFAVTMLTAFIIGPNDIQLGLMGATLVWYVLDLFWMPRMVREWNGAADAG